MGTEKKISVIIKVFSTIIGIGLIVVAIFMTLHIQQVRSSYVITIATVDSITEHINKTGRNHTVYVSYEYDGQTYNNVHYNSYNRSMHEGTSVSVYVNPNNPGQAESGSYTPVTLLIAVGVVLLIAGRMVSKVLGGGSSSKQIKELRETGLRLEAIIEETVVNSNIKLNGKYPFQIRCKYDDPATGSSYNFMSNNIYGFERDIFVEGRTIPVYVDRNDYSKYFVDYSVALDPQWHMS